jgi:hypothetical protein
VAQENEWQKKAGLPGSTTIGVSERPMPTSEAKKKIEDLRLTTARSGKTAGLYETAAA